MFEKKKSFFGKLKENLEVKFLGKTEIDEDLFEEIEEALILSDIGMETSNKIVQELKEKTKETKNATPEIIKSLLTEIITKILLKNNNTKLVSDYPLIIFAIGVNGSGKTTTIAKLANYFLERGHKPLLVAADTFRAAATEQLNIWAKKLGVDIIKRTEGEDPGAVLYDAINFVKENKGYDVLIVDTAGRLQTKKNLMSELSKLDKIIEKGFPDAKRENLLILDATTGKNALSQTKEFNEATSITGIVLTKLDGTTKGGFIISIADEFAIPIKFIGTGEKLADLEEFDAKKFAETIF